jgi:hypothetical protein
MPVQQAIQGAFIDLMSNLGFQGELDLHDRRDLSSGSTSQERLEEGAFLLQCEILVTPPAFAWGLDGSYPCLIVGGNHTVDSRRRHAHRPGNVLGFARSCQSLRNDLPSLTAPGALLPLHPLLDRILGQMRGSTRDAISHQAGLLSLRELLSRIAH